MVFLCKCGQNPPIGSEDRVHTRLIFTVFIVWLPSKLGQGHGNLISFIYIYIIFNDIIHKVWPESIIWFKRYSVGNIFWSKFDIQSADVTLKMRSRSPKFNHFFPIPLWCLPVWSKIHKLVQEIDHRQGSFISFYSVVTLKIMSRSAKCD